MPEAPEQLYERAKDALRMPPVGEWETWPFDGELRPRPLQPPVEEDTPRRGVGGVDCWACTASDDEFLWTNQRWRLVAPEVEYALPVAIWDDVLPPLPEEIRRENLAAVVAALEASASRS